MTVSPSPRNRAPRALWIVRHGQSAGNVAWEQAEAAKRLRIELTGRDCDVPLSPLGERQARALGRWIAALPEGERPTTALTSPYLRARMTASIALEAARLDAELAADERLREREFGIVDGLTRYGIAHHFPEQAERRARLGKFYYRPPGGESWCDVILRARSAVHTLKNEYAGESVLVVAHQVIVLGLRYVLEEMTEREILDIDAQGDVANCSVTSYTFDPTRGRRGTFVLRGYNYVAPLEEAGEKVTTEPDAPVVPR